MWTRTDLGAVPMCGLPISLRTPRPTVIPVRAGGRLAPQVHNDAAVSMGRFTPNEYCPTKELFAW